jgi:ankyrin repeat protein
MVDHHLCTHVAKNVAKSAEHFGRALIQAAPDGKTAEVERIVLSANATVVNFTVNFADADRGGLTALFCASGNGHEDLVTLLLLHGADPNDTQ